MGFLPTLLMEEQGLNQGPAAVLSAIALAMNVPGNLLGGWLLQRGVKRWALIALASLIMGGCAFGIFPHGLTLSTRYLGALFFMSAGGMIPASALHGATVHAPRRELVATTNGFLMQGAQIGLLSGPPIVAAAVSHSGSWQSAPLILALAAILCIILAILIRSVEKHKRIA
jgi:MFS family permease